MNTVESCQVGIPETRSDFQAVKRAGQGSRSLSLLSIACALVLGACGTVNLQNLPIDANAESSPLSQAPGVSVVDRSIVADIIRAAVQIYPPLNTTLQVSKDNDEPLQAYFIKQFAAAGYGIQRVSADQGSNFFTFSRTERVDDQGEQIISLDSSIGAVDIGRDYLTPRANTISPASAFRLSGTRAAVEVTDTPNASFAVTNPDNSKAEYAASMNLNEQAPPVISLITDDLVDRVAARVAQNTSLQGLNSSRVEVSNLFYANQSNFSSVLDDYEQIERQIVVFGNDSMILGETNKSLIEQFVRQRFDSDDLISLVGCSNGPTALDIGNEGLALGRAERVTQALLSQGIARDSILDEGCWAPVSAGDKFPSRGVVLELWRRAS
ncbi:MAG: hypothetical protein AB8B97_22600 [Granulosicoccus sp.]